MHPFSPLLLGEIGILEEGAQILKHNIRKIISDEPSFENKKEVITRDIHLLYVR